MRIGDSPRWNRGSMATLSAPPAHAWLAPQPRSGPSPRYDTLRSSRTVSRPDPTTPAERQQLTDCSCGRCRCRPPSDPRTGHPGRRRRRRFDRRTPRRTDSPGRPGSQDGSRCRAGTTLNPLRLRTNASDCNRAAHRYRCPDQRALLSPRSRTTSRRRRNVRSCLTPLLADSVGMYAANCPAR